MMTERQKPRYPWAIGADEIIALKVTPGLKDFLKELARHEVRPVSHQVLKILTDALGVDYYGKPK